MSRIKTINAENGGKVIRVRQKKNWILERCRPVAHRVVVIVDI